MSRTRQRLVSSILVSPHFWISVALGLLLVILAAAEVPVFPLALLGAGFVIIAGFALANVSRSRRYADPGETPTVSPAPADNRVLTRLSSVIGEALAAVASQPDGTHKDAITDKLVALGVQFRAVASGAGAFRGTESWHVAHDAILTLPELKEYRAVVRVQTAECVRDPAIMESLRATFAAVHRRILVERILVLPERLWPRSQLLPADDIWPWIEDQHNHGLRVILLRERDLAAEADLPVDTCVFDDWGVGTRDLDDRSQTVRVALDFTPAMVRAALEALDRLSHLGISVRELLDRAEHGG